MFVDVGAVFHVVVVEEGGRCGVLVVEVMSAPAPSLRTVRRRGSPHSGSSVEAPAGLTEPFLGETRLREVRLALYKIPRALRKVPLYLRKASSLRKRARSLRSIERSLVEGVRVSVVISLRLLRLRSFRFAKSVGAVS